MARRAQKRESKPAPQREQLIRTAAYFRAMGRGFQNGDPVEDWFAAEREINQILPTAEQKRAELAAYENVRNQLETLLGRVRHTVDAAAINRVIDAAAEAVDKTGKYTGETINKARSTLRKDLAWTAQQMGPRWEEWTEKSADMFAVWRDRGEVFLSKAAGAVGEWLKQAATMLEQPLRYRSGEMAASGAFECVDCGARLEFAAAGHIPLCPGCGKTEFRRV